jgi:hypothetical protein
MDIFREILGILLGSLWDKPKPHEATRFIVMIVTQRVCQLTSSNDYLDLHNYS